MIFSRIVYAALLIGIVTGILLSCLQVLKLNPILFAAERYEISVDAEQGVEDAHVGHVHEQPAWKPAEAVERTAFTFLANMLASTGFAAIMLALMCQFRKACGRAISWSQGALWGLAGYGALFLAPAIGMPPEIPGAMVAGIEHRQLWWWLCAFSASVGFGLLAFARPAFRALGIPLLALPYVVGAPRVDGRLFPHPDPSAAQALDYLHQQFVVASAITNLVFWLALGLACRYAFNRWFRQLRGDDEPGHA